MSVYGLDQLVEDATKKHAATNHRRPQLNFKEVWAAVDRYTAACLEEGRGVSLPNLCRIGWQVVRLKTKCQKKPYFELSEAFRRVAGLEIGKGIGPPPDLDLCPIEEFNFSKAAIKFSGQLTKDQTFTGWRFLVRQLSDIIKQGRSVNLVFSFGKLVAKERQVHMVFSPDLYLAHGLDVPDDHADDENRDKPVATFSSALGSALQDLKLRGTGAGVCDQNGNRCPVDEQQVAPDGWRYRGGTGAQGTADVLTCGGGESNLNPRTKFGYSANATGATTKCAERSVITPKYSSFVPPGFQPQDVAYDQALHAHITDLELIASEKIREKFEYNCILQQGSDSDSVGKAARRVKNNEHAACLQEQIDDKARTRAEPESKVHVLDRPFRFGTSSMTLAKALNERPPEKPLSCSTVARAFEADAPASGSSARPANSFRDSLDLQVEEKRLRIAQMKARNRRFEDNQVRHDNAEKLAFEDLVISERASERVELLNAWDKELQLKNMFKNMNQASGKTRAPGTQSTAASGGNGNGSQTSRQSRTGASTPRSQQAPGSARGLGSAHGADSLGAAASLALQIKPMVAA